MPVTIYDIARELQVSAPTVSRVLSGRGCNLISSETRERVVDAARRMGYRPNASARALVTGKTMTIGLLTPSLLERTGPHFARMVEAIEVKTRGLGYRLILRGDPAGVSAHGQVDGWIIVADPGDDDASISDQLVPQVRIWNRRDPTPGWISWSDHTGMSKATAHLTGLGHRRIVGLFGDAEPVDPPADKVAGFRAATQAAGAEGHEIFGALSPDQFENGHILVRALLASKKRFTAIQARNDFLALGAMRALREAGLDVPGDVSVAGYNDTMLARCATPGLTSLRTPISEAGVLAVERLVAGRDDAALSEGVELETVLIARQSTGPLGG